MRLDRLRAFRRAVAGLSLLVSLGASAVSAASQLNADPVIPGVGVVQTASTPAPVATAPTAATPTRSTSALVASPPGFGSVAPSRQPSNAIGSAPSDSWRTPSDVQTPTSGDVTGLAKPILDLLTNPDWRHSAVSLAITLFRALFLWELAETAGVWLWQGRRRVNFDTLLNDYIGKLVQAALMVLLIIKGPDVLGWGVSYTKTMALQVVSSSSSITDSTTAQTYADVMNGPVDIGSIVAFGIKNGAQMLTAKVNLPVDDSGSPCDPWAMGGGVGGPAGGVVNCVTGGAISNATHALAEQVVGFVIALIAAVAIWLAFLLIGIELFGLTVEAVFQQNIGAVFLGFLGYNRVARYGWNYFYYIINVCGRMFVIYAMVGVGEVFFQMAIAKIKAGGVDPVAMFLICAAAWLFFFMVRKINKWAATILSGQSLADGMNDYAKPAITAAGVAAAGAMLAAGAAAGGAAALKGGLIKNGIMGSAGGGGGGTAVGVARPVRPKLPPSAGRNGGGASAQPPQQLPMSPKALSAGRGDGGGGGGGGSSVSQPPPAQLALGPARPAPAEPPATTSPGKTGATGHRDGEGSASEPTADRAGAPKQSSAPKQSADAKSSEDTTRKAGAQDVAKSGAKSPGGDRGQNARDRDDLNLEPPASLGERGAKSGGANANAKDGASTSGADPKAASKGIGPSTTRGRRPQVDDNFWQDVDRVSPGAGRASAAVSRAADGGGVDGGARSSATSVPPVSGGQSDAAAKGGHDTSGSESHAATATSGSPGDRGAADARRPHDAGERDEAAATAVGRDGTVYEGEYQSPDDDGHWEPGDRPDSVDDGIGAQSYAEMPPEPERRESSEREDRHQTFDATSAAAGFYAGGGRGPRRATSDQASDPGGFQGGGGFQSGRGPRARYEQRGRSAYGQPAAPRQQPTFGPHTTAAMRRAATGPQSTQGIAQAIAAQANKQDAQRRRSELRRRISHGLQHLMTSDVTQGHNHARVDFEHLR